MRKELEAGYIEHNIHVYMHTYVQVRKELEAGAQERKTQLSGTSAKGETKNDLSAANDSENSAGQVQERKGGEVRN
jgi:hypothetical protein